MTRPTRMLVVLGLFGVGTVVVLSMMAQRYGKLLRSVERPPTAISAPSEPAAGVDPRTGEGSAASESIETQARALRYVDAFIEARRALAEGPRAERLMAYPEPGWPLVEKDLGILDRTLADAGLDRATYLGILGLYRDWKEGDEDLSGPLPAAFAQRREELLALE